MHADVDTPVFEASENLLIAPAAAGGDTRTFFMGPHTANRSGADQALRGVTLPLAAAALAATIRCNEEAIRIQLEARARLVDTMETVEARLAELRAEERAAAAAGAGCAAAAPRIGLALGGPSGGVPSAPAGKDVIVISDDEDEPALQQSRKRERSATPPRSAAKQAMGAASRSAGKIKSNKADNGAEWQRAAGGAWASMNAGYMDVSANGGLTEDAAMAEATRLSYNDAAAGPMPPPQTHAAAADAVIFIDD